jgi:hypothetical protein
MHKLESSDVQEPTGPPRVSAAGSHLPAFPTHSSSEFGEPLICHQHNEMNVCRRHTGISVNQPDFLEAVHQSLRLILERPKDAERSSEEVLVLLTRHRIDTRRSSEYISLHAEYDDDHPNTPKNITIFAKTQGIYTDNPHVLVRTPASIPQHLTDPK